MNPKRKHGLSVTAVTQGTADKLWYFRACLCRYSGALGNSKCDHWAGGYESRETAEQAAKRSSRDGE